jgi:hypothetical protein
MRAASVVLMLLVLAGAGVAGCVGEQPGPDGTGELAAETVLASSAFRDRFGLPVPMPAEVVVAERPVVSTVMVHEDASGDAMDLSSIVEGADNWEPHDAELVYHGMHGVFDEWGRSIVAHVFRYTPWVVTITQAEFSPRGILLRGEWQERHREYAFDATDGRFLGPLSLDSSGRAFASPDERSLFVWDEAGPLFLFMLAHAAGDDLATHTVHAFDHEYGLRPYTGQAPLAGDCDVFEFRRLDKARDVLAAAVAGDDARVLACFDDAVPMPLWVWRGTQSDAHWWQRQASALRLAPLGGTPLAPVAHARMPWLQLEPLLPPLADVLPLAPVFVPPVDHEDDWADKVRARSAALLLNPDFMLYQAKHDTLYVHEAVMGWPPLFSTFIETVIGDGNDPTSFDEEAWLFATEGSGFYWGLTSTRWGDAEADGDDVHVSYQRGADFDGWSGTEYPSPDSLPDIPAIGAVVAGYGRIAPQDARFGTWIVWPLFEELDDLLMMTWWAIEDCFIDMPARPPMFAAVDGLDGHLIAAGNAVTGEGGCAAGVGFDVPVAPMQAATLHAWSDGTTSLQLPDGSMRWLAPTLE